MLRRRNGFTMVELMIAVAVIAVIGIIVVGVLGHCSGGPQANAQQGARAWADGLGLEVKGINCVNRDTDGDGYISCSVSTNDGQVHSIECASGWGMNTGCRSPKARIPLRTRWY